MGQDSGAAGRQWLRAGRVGRAHGLDGSFHVRSPNPPLLSAGTRVWVTGRELWIERRAGTDQRPIVRLGGYDDRSAAEQLRGAELLVSRADAPELGPDEWWAEDLEGCAVSNGSRRIGTVRRLLAMPSCEVLEVERTGGEDDLLVPLVRAAVLAVDLEHRQIEVDVEFLGIG